MKRRRTDEKINGEVISLRDDNEQHEKKES